MEFDFKITTWERVTVDPKDEKKILELIKSGDITSANDVFAYVFNAKCIKLDDVDVQMTVEENGGEATIDVLEDGDSIYSNAKI